MASTQQLPHLQSLVKKDPVSYKDDFILQRNHFMNEMELFKLRPLQSSDRLIELLEFMSHTSVCYPEEAQEFSNVVFSLLEKQADVLSPAMRLKLFQSLAVTRAKAKTNPLLLLKLSFKLFTVRDKPFRVALSEYIFKEIKSQSSGKQNFAFTRELQAHLHKIISEDEAKIAQKCVELLNEVYRRKIWTDARTVNIIVSACYHHDHKVQIAAVQFLLGIDSQMLEDEEEEEEKKKDKVEINKHEHSKKTKKRARDVEKQQAKVKKSHKDTNTVGKPIFPALTVIHDPHKLAEAMFRKCRNTGEKFEYKLLLMNLVSQLIGCHQLMILGYYTFLQRYLTAHQNEVTKILAYFLQACHERIPPDELLPMVKSIAYNFVSERSSNEQIALGINCIREVFGRCPSVLLEEDMSDFVQDLAQYNRKSHKIVMAAARSLINLVRERYPLLLQSKDRGRGSDKTKVPAAYGAVRPATQESMQENENAEDEEEGSEDGSEGEWEEASDDEEEDGEEGEGQDVEEEEELYWKENGDEANPQSKSKSAKGTDSGDDNSEDEEGEWEEVEDSEEEDGEEGDGWEEVSHDGDEEDSDEEEKEEEDVNHPVLGKRRKRGEKVRGRLDVNKVLSDEDVARIAKLKALSNKGKNRVQFQDVEADEEEDEVEEEDEDSDSDGDEANEAMDYVINPDILLPSGKGAKTTKIEKIKSILSGRSEKKFEGGHRGGLTNQEKLRKKNYVMVRRGKDSVHNKNRRASSAIRTANAKRVSSIICVSQLLCLFLSLCRKIPTAETAGSAGAHEEKGRRMFAVLYETDCCNYLHTSPLITDNLLLGSLEIAAWGVDNLRSSKGLSEDAIQQFRFLHRG